MAKTKKIKRRSRRALTEDFNQQMVTCYQNVRMRNKFSLDYKLTPPRLYR